MEYADVGSWYDAEEVTASFNARLGTHGRRDDWSASADSIYAQGDKYVVSATQIAGSLLGQPGVCALKDMGAKKIAFAYLDEPFPAALTQGVVDLVKELGMEVTARSVCSWHVAHAAVGDRNEICYPVPS